jgi:hypothetical protein
MTCLEGGDDGAPIDDEGAVRQSIRNHIRVLIHRQHRHPVRGIARQLESAIDVADRIRERPAPRHDQQSALATRRDNHREDGLEVLRMRKECTSNFHHDFDHRSNLQLENLK